MKDRFESLRNIIVENFRSTNLLVTNPTNLFFLFGLSLNRNDREVYCLIQKDKVLLLTYNMYYPGLVDKLKNISFVEVIKIDSNKGIYNTIKEYVGSEKVIFEEYDLSFSEYKQYKSSEIDLIESDSLIHKIRQVKDGVEIDRIKEAVKITDNHYSNTVQYISLNKGGLSESSIFRYLNLEVLEDNSLSFGFQPIIAYDKASIEPHYELFSFEPIKNGPLLIDMGIKKNGYSGDLSRTIHIGNSSEEFKEMYSRVLECNKTCIEMIAPGVSLMDVHLLAVAYFKKHDLDKYFIHSIGHSLGLDIHERIFPDKNGEKALLKEGMVITIEPGIYLPEKWGIRIEDVVLVTSDGYEVLNDQSNKELVEL